MPSAMEKSACMPARHMGIFAQNFGNIFSITMCPRYKYVTTFQNLELSTLNDPFESDPLNTLKLT
jgi:hypothetical protein